MLIFRSVLNRSLNQFKLTSQFTLRCSSTDQKTNKQNAENTENSNPKLTRELQEQAEIFKNFTIEASKLSMEDKQHKFLDMLFRFKDQNIHTQRLGDCEFVLGCLKILKPLNLHKELEIYKQLMSVFPKEKMQTINYYQQMLNHYPKHQETAMLILEEMGMNSIFPDKEMRIIVRDIFGGLSDVHRRVLMMNYWNSKLLRKSPFPIPDKPIDNYFELSKLALKKMCWTVDAETKIQRYDSSIATIENEPNEWILTAQSNNQKELIKRLDELVYVEGPFTCFVQHEKSVKYFILKTNTPNPLEFEYERKKLDVSRMKIKTFGRKDVIDIVEEKIKLHHQEDGHILATCITERASESSVLAWVRILCKLNKNLDNLQFVFNVNYDQEPKGCYKEDNKKASNQNDREDHKEKEDHKDKEEDKKD